MIRIGISKKEAFSLIEIIVVFIIIGFLIALAVPSYFSFINKSKANEALAALDVYKKQIESCIQVHKGSESSCASINFTDSPNFHYAFVVPPQDDLPQGNGYIADWKVEAIFSTASSQGSSTESEGQAGSGPEGFSLIIDPLPTINLGGSPSDVIYLQRQGGDTSTPTFRCESVGIFQGICDTYTGPFYL
jgi:type II secretory pathway pseudopilin PulG